MRHKTKYDLLMSSSLVSNFRFTIIFTPCHMHFTFSCSNLSILLCSYWFRVFQRCCLLIIWHSFSFRRILLSPFLEYVALTERKWLQIIENLEAKKKKVLYKRYEFKVFGSSKSTNISKHQSTCGVLNINKNRLKFSVCKRQKLWTERL